jgi:hypothetical protein
MHDGGGGHFGGGHMGGHVGGHPGGHVGGHAANPGHHHHHGLPGTVPANPGYISNGEQAGHPRVAVPGQFTPVLVLVGLAVVLAIVLLVI